jgi:hypothetical protein
MNVRKIFMLMLLSMFSLCALSNGYAQELLNEEQITEPAFEKVPGVRPAKVPGVRPAILQFE